ncbi:diaminobutyrate acetyltransferase [Amphibacillus jilinensis]|uniref:diaminobutyrate acetyltransferase n=1 Tax=Amphibacillus jilinensis TaxID=1216008 RepID=UPI00030D2440|nr:diaminobutyrate acetyltransferase [Amphibacillus jilinensis]
MINQKIEFSPPNQDDGKQLWRLVNQTTLDNNSAYKYIMMSHYFTDTCVVAKNDQHVVGFITGFISPKQPDTVFVWQIGVDPEYSGRGIGSSLLTTLMDQVKDKGVNYIEATITPSNKASQALFKKFASHHQAVCNIQSFFTEDLFPNNSEYEEELKFRIGPIRENNNDLGGKENVRRYESI